MSIMMYNLTNLIFLSGLLKRTILQAWVLSKNYFISQKLTPIYVRTQVLSPNGVIQVNSSIIYYLPNLQGLDLNFA